ncbi:hypothetical protein SLEP1_g24308 [Rubroshorea leprosula]|uniref:Uncharacterized protein n=1 Tax=Rubroshorea leprosula TaxID=152421 RepID=A0AAV5JPL3_9ROSI|nr:hypothetical protein SLEP1_g24308 [Rubroshorea leprosula]
MKLKSMRGIKMLIHILNRIRKCHVPKSKFEAAADTVHS